VMQMAHLHSQADTWEGTHIKFADHAAGLMLTAHPCRRLVPGHGIRAGCPNQALAQACPLYKVDGVVQVAAPAQHTLLPRLHRPHARRRACVPSKREQTPRATRSHADA